MKEQDIKELNDETRARGVKRTSDIKIAEVSTTTSKKKRAKKTQADATEPAGAQNLFVRPLKGLKNMNSVRALSTPPVMWPTEILP